MTDRFVDAGPAIAKVRDLVDRDASYLAIAQASGVHVDTVRNLHRGINRQVRSSVDAALARVEIDQCRRRGGRLADAMRSGSAVPGEWARDAACADHPVDLWTQDHADDETVAEAKAICRRCPVMAACDAHHALHGGAGIIAGRTERERRKQRRTA